MSLLTDIRLAIHTGQITEGCPGPDSILEHLREDKLFLLALASGTRLQVRWKWTYTPSGSALPTVWKVAWRPV